MKKGVFHCESGEEKPFVPSKRIVVEIDESDCYFPRRKDFIGEVFYPEEVWDHGDGWYGFWDFKKEYCFYKVRLNKPINPTEVGSESL